MRFYILLLILFLSFNGVYSATIKGKVKDASGEILIGASIMILDTRTGAMTDKFGKYHIDNIESGHYNIIARYMGFKKEAKMIKVSSKNEILTIDFSLEEEKITTESVIIEARAEKETESSARLSEKNANNVINVITAESIEHSTDQTSADVLQRVSGLSLVRSQGEGKYVIMRGLEQRFNNTLVNGVKIPSPESRDRFVPLDIFPSQLVQRIEVTKSLTPDMEGDAIGGSTNLVLRDAHDNLLLNCYTSTGYSSSLINSKFSSFNNSAINDLDPDRLAGSVDAKDPTTLLKNRVIVQINSFSRGNLKITTKQAPPDANLALILGNRFFNKSFGIIIAGTYQNTYNNSESNYYGLNESVNNIGVPYLSTLQNRKYSTNKTRGGISAKADYIFDGDNELNFSYLLVAQQILEYRHTLQTQIDGGRGDADLNYTDRTAERIQNITNYQLEGNHNLTPEIKLKWIGNISDAVQDRPDEAEIALTQNYDSQMNLEPNQWLKSVSRNWRKNDDKQYLGKIDLSYNPAYANLLTIKAGGLIQKLSRVNYENGYNLMPVMEDGKSQIWKGIDSITINPVALAAGSPVYGYQNYKANETILSGFLQGIFIFGDFQILGGIRVENTADDYFTMAPAIAGRNKAVISYTDLLPSIHLRYQFTQENVFRFSVSRSLNRPSYFDLVPAQQVSEEFTSTGNPNLHPSHSLNLDSRYEHYFNVFDYLSGGIYFKNISDDIEQTFVQSGNNLIFSKINAGTAIVYGFELAGAKRFGDFGITGNYSFAQTSIKSLKQTPKKGIDGLPIYPAPIYMQTRQMQGQSNHIINLSLIYRNDSIGTNINLAYNLTGRKLDQVDYRDGFDVYQKDNHNLDLSAEQLIFSKFKIYIKLINLLNLPVKYEVPGGEVINHPAIIVREEYSKLKGSIGLSYKL